MHRRLIGALFFALLSLSTAASAQQELTGSNTVAYDFAGFTAAGFAPAPAAGQLDSNEWIARGVQALSLDFGGTSAHADFANGISPGGELDGGLWAFTPVPSACGAGSRTLLGVQPSNRTFTPGSFRVRVRNASGAPLEAISLEYTLAHLNDAGRSMVHTLSVIQLDEASAQTDLAEVPELRFETPVAASASPAWVSACRRAWIELPSPAPSGSFIVISFDFDDGSGADQRDEIGITDVRIGTMPLPDGGVIEIDGGAIEADASALDAGALEDAGATDGGATADAGPREERDAGTRDGGRSDAGRAGDASAPRMDAGPADGAEDGCGCSAPGRAPSAPGLLSALPLLALVCGRARRSARRPACSPD